MRIAVLGDTHDDAVGREALVRALTPYLSDVTHILHTGDVTTEGFLDDLERFAPVFAVRSFVDPDLPPRLTDGPRALTFDGCRVELIRTLEGEPIEREDVDVVVHGATHIPAVTAVGRTMYVNPGAPVFTESPTIAFIDVTEGRVRASVELLPAPVTG